jgi:hypothetical protein
MVRYPSRMTTRRDPLYAQLVCGFGLELADAYPEMNMVREDGPTIGRLIVMKLEIPSDFCCRSGVQDHGASAPSIKSSCYRPLLESDPAVVPEIDHRIGEGFESVVQLADSIEAKQPAAELVLPGEHSFNRTAALGENGGVEERPATALRLGSTAYIWVDVWDHAAIKNRLAVQATIVNAIEG